MKAVGYAKKVSNLLVKEGVPIKEQNDRIRDYAKSEGFNIDRFYLDKSDDPMRDTAFQELRIDGMNRRFDLVILDSIFRCGKNYAYARNLLYMTFYKIGIHFVVLEDGINTMNMTEDEVERYFYDLRCKHAEILEYSCRQELYRSDKKISQCWERYGYLLNEDQTELLIDDEVVDVIQLIFNMAAAGVKKVAIAKELNRIHAETPSNHLSRVAVRRVSPGRKDWIAEAVGRVLATEEYMGDDHAFETEGVIYPRIIEPEVFHKAQEIIKPNHIKRYNKHYLLKRKIYFQDTDERLSYREKETDGKQVAYYHRSQDDVCLIEYEDVIKELCRVIEQEKELASRVCKVNHTLKLSAICDIDDSYRERAKELFRLSVEAQNGNVELYEQYESGEITPQEYDSAHEAIMQKQRQVNDQFHEMMLERKKRITYLGKENPWARRFLKYDPHKNLNCDTVNALVRRVEIYPDRKVVIYLNTDGKEYMPEKMLKEAMADGEEE